MKKLSLIIILMCSFACQQKKDTVRANVAGVTNGLVGGLSGTSCIQNTTTTTTGAIYDGSQIQFAAGDAPGSFQDRVKAFLSASIAPNDIGNVNGQLSSSLTNGVRFVGLIKLDTSGNVIGAQSRLTIGVYDSIWANNVIYNSSEQPITIEFNQATKGSQITGQFNTQTGVGVLSLRDNYGEVRFEGTIDAQNFSGLVKWANTASVIGSNTQGTIGNFSIPRCGIVQ